MVFRQLVGDHLWLYHPNTKLIFYLLFQCKPILLFYPFAFVVPTVFIREERRTNVLWSTAFTATTAQCS